MELVTKEMIKNIVDVAKVASTEIGEQAVDIVNQALNYALFEACISLVGILSLYLGYYFIHKILTAAQSVHEIENLEASKKSITNIKMLKQLVFVVFTGVILYNAQHSVKTIGKITISPKVYLLEEGVKILEKLKSK